ncbi:hypothetical protein M408DRAFT_330539 [Serendipita vermifera MAFF 305830]|uniref:F-box/LRR-repeat protein 15/At3g58940/PEG3-like LRR domain-containing protein n=1 Tax=Serendipita vermifera MAFF 305830 TaxID=933852 RepID=A0A0C3APX5_SERVB|nr:hypothetical protein M408DRAFT_330539 [Serendipita vermifera MAFF 305830]
MLHGSFPCLNSSDKLPESETLTFLSFPNEILDLIIRALVGDPVLNLPRFRSPENNAIHTVRLVNRRLASLGRYYLLFKHKCISERQLEYETNLLSDDALLKRKYTRQLEIARVPVVHWLAKLQCLYPCVTHLTLTYVRLSMMETQPEQTSCLVLPSVKHLSIQMDIHNEKALPSFLRAFPNLVTLVIDNDPACGYYGMDTSLLLSAPSLPYLTTLYRPAFKRNYLTFSNNHGQNFATQHQHADFVFNAQCNECLLWRQRTEDIERITITQLQWHFPSLREVLVPRLVFEDWMPITELSAILGLPITRRSHITDDLGLIEFMRRRSDVAVWRLEPDNHTDCTSDCMWRKRPSHQFFAVGDLHMTIEIASVGLHNPTTAEPAKPNVARPQFHILSPKEYNEHSICKKGRTPAFMRDDPKFWWTKDDKQIYLPACYKDIALSMKNADTTAAQSSEGAVTQGTHTILVGPWDL